MCIWQSAVFSNTLFQCIYLKWALWQSTQGNIDISGNEQGCVFQGLNIHIWNSIACPQWMWFMSALQHFIYSYTCFNRTLIIYTLSDCHAFNRFSVSTHPECHSLPECRWPLLFIKMYGYGASWAEQETESLFLLLSMSDLSQDRTVRCCIIRRWEAQCCNQISFHHLTKFLKKKLQIPQNQAQAYRFSF